MRTNMENRWIMDLAHERGRDETCLLELSIFVQCLNPQNYAASANGCSRCLL